MQNAGRHLHKYSESLNNYDAINPLWSSMFPPARAFYSILFSIYFCSSGELINAVVVPGKYEIKVQLTSVFFINIFFMFLCVVRDLRPEGISLWKRLRSLVCILMRINLLCGKDLLLLLAHKGGGGRDLLARPKALLIETSYWPCN